MIDGVSAWERRLVSGKVPAECIAPWTPTPDELQRRIAEVREAKLEFKRTGKPPALLVQIYGDRKKFMKSCHIAGD